MNNELRHYGVRGQKWGIRNGPPYPIDRKNLTYQEKQISIGEKLKVLVRYTGNVEGAQYVLYTGLENLANAKTANFGDWGRTENTNVCYVSGTSGSGKTTTALSLLSPGDHLIDLDSYFEPHDANDKTVTDYLDKDFVKYLKKKVPDYNELSNSQKYARFSNEWWNTAYALGEAIEDFGKAQYKNQKRVVVEGTQIADNMLHKSKNAYKGKPIVILASDLPSTAQRVLDRDGKFRESPKAFVNQYEKWYKSLKNLSQIVGAEKGSEAVDAFIFRYSR